MEKLHLIILVFASLVIGAFSLNAQNGQIRGQVIDNDTGEAIMFGAVLIQETQTGTTTDLDGQYTLDLPEGIYNLSFSYLGYAELNITDVLIEQGKETVLDVAMIEESEMLDEIVVTATQVRNTEAAVLTIKRKAPGLLDGLPKKAMEKSGDSDVGSAIKRVTGVSVEGGKHVVVRGLGDRYSKTVLNDMDIPGLDPDRNSVQLDVFPTNVVDNIIVYKSFTPDLSGDFTGGMVNIITKDFPSRKTLSITASASYNPDMHLNDNFITYQGGETDYLGMDDGTRALPINPGITPPNRTSSSLAENLLLENLTRRFTPIMSTIRERNGLNQSYSASFGNQVNRGKFDIGYTLSANYKQETEYFEDAEFGIFFKEGDQSITQLSRDLLANVQKGNTNILWNVLAGSAIKTKNHKISLSLMHSQNGTSRAAFIDQKRLEFGIAEIEKQTLEYTERSITNLMLVGKHNLSTDKLSLSWKLSPTISNMDEPDIRTTAYETTNGEYELNQATGGGITRVWRNQEENIFNGKVDLTYKFGTNRGLESKLKFGVAGVYKDRSFSVYDYIFNVHRRSAYEIDGNPDQFFTEDFYWNKEKNAGTHLIANFEPSKSYDARQQILSGYVMNEFPISERFKAIYGLRVEKTDNWYTGERQVIVNPDTDLYQDRKVLDELNFLPSVNLVYSLIDDSLEGKTLNLRFSGSQTVARPSFKEKSIAQITDRISDRTFIGNINLEQTNILNTDFRIEYYLPKGQIFSLSSFYKSFEKPIEMTAFNAQSPSSFTPRNVGDADLVGIELELRKNLDFVNESLNNIYLGMNATIVNSTVEMPEEEFEGRLLAARDGEIVENKRNMQGQSPYLINANIGYSNIDDGWEINIAYNVQGERLSIVGIGSVPDVFERPFNSMNFRLSKNLGEKYKLSIGVNNILASTKLRVYKSFESDDRIFDRFEIGRTISFSASYSL